MEELKELLKEFETFKSICKTNGETFIIDYAINSVKNKIKKIEPNNESAENLFDDSNDMV